MIMARFRLMNGNLWRFLTFTALGTLLLLFLIGAGHYITPEGGVKVRVPYIPHPIQGKSVFGRQPNILFLLVDDLGYNDVGYHAKNGRSAIRTPNIDELARQGVRLENYYVQPLCSPTRSQLMTGRYQIRMGIQHYLFEHARPQCLPLDEVTLPTKLREAGYTTHALGKWHLGFCMKACLPTSRGFDSFFGLYTGGGDHWYYNRTVEGMKAVGLDLHDDTVERLRDAVEFGGVYSAELFTSKAEQIIRDRQPDKPFFVYLAYKNVHAPLQAPQRYRDIYKDSIKPRLRQKYAGMVSAVDESVKNLTQTLKNEGVWNNTIIIFSSDNGGSLVNNGNNWPLRGGKMTLNEGGVRAVGFVSSPLLPVATRGTINRELIHVSDWFPTFVRSVAGSETYGTKPLDGFDVWRTISEGTRSPRTEILHNIDPMYELAAPNNEDVELLSSLSPGNKFNPSLRAAIRVGDWKLLTGLSGQKVWHRPPESPNITAIKSCPGGDSALQLYNILHDPGETCNVAQDNQDIVAKLLGRLDYYNAQSVPVNYPPRDQRSNPQLRGGFWGPYLD